MAARNRSGALSNCRAMHQGRGKDVPAQQKQNKTLSVPQILRPFTLTPQNGDNSPQLKGSVGEMW